MKRGHDPSERASTRAARAPSEESGFGPGGAPWPSLGNPRGVVALASAAAEGRPRPPHPPAAQGPGELWLRTPGHVSVRPPQRQTSGARGEAHLSPKGQGVLPPSKGPPTRPPSAQGWEGLTALRTQRGTSCRPTSSRGHPLAGAPARASLGAPPALAPPRSRQAPGPAPGGGVGRGRPGAVGEARGPTHGAPRRRGDSSPGGGGRSRRVEPGTPSPLRLEAPGPTCPPSGCQAPALRPCRRRGRGSETGRRGRGAESGFPWGAAGTPPARSFPSPHTLPAAGPSVLAGPDLAEPWTGLRGRRGLFSPPRAGPSWGGGPPRPRLRAPPTGCTPSSDSPPGDAHSPPDSRGPRPREGARVGCTSGSCPAPPAGP